MEAGGGFDWIGFGLLVAGVCGSGEGIVGVVVVVVVVVISNIRAIDHEDNGMTACVVARPQLPQRVLPAYVPDLEVHVWQGDGRDILTDGRDGFLGDGGGGGEVEGFDGGEEGGFTGVVEAEEEDGVFWVCVLGRWMGGWGIGGGGTFFRCGVHIEGFG